MIKRLETESIAKLLVEFSWPAIAGMIIHSCYNIVSRIYIGNIGDDGVNGLAALTVCFPIMLIFFSIAAMCGLGGSSLYSIKLGEKKYEEAGKVLGISIILVSILTVILVVFAFLNLNSLLTHFGASETILPYAHDYIVVILLGSVCGGISFTVNSFVRADGKPSVAMYTMIIGAAFNIIFTPVFLYVFHWGMTGAALATIGGQTMTMIWVLVFFCSEKATVRISKKIFVVDIGLMKRILAMGTPPFVMQLINSVIMLIINKSLIVYGGDLAMSAMGITQSIQTIMIMPIVGISQGAQPIIGYNYGAGMFDRVAETVKKSIVAATCFVLIVYFLIKLLPWQFISMFSSNEDLKSMGVHCISIWFTALPVVGLQIIGSCYFQSIGKVIPSLILTSTRQLIFLIPAILIFPLFWKFDGLLYSAPTSDLLSALVTGICLYLDMKKELKARQA